jgi:hypothetical protein
MGALRAAHGELAVCVTFLKYASQMKTTYRQCMRTQRHMGRFAVKGRDDLPACSCNRWQACRGPDADPFGCLSLPLVVSAP